MLKTSKGDKSVLDMWGGGKVLGAKIEDTKTPSYLIFKMHYETSVLS